MLNAQKKQKQNKKQLLGSIAQLFTAKTSLATPTRLNHPLSSRIQGCSTQNLKPRPYETDSGVKT